MRIAVIAGGQTAEATGTLGSADQLGATAERAGHEVSLLELPAQADARVDFVESVRSFDVAIPLIAGLEGTLELFDVPYVGSPPDAAALAANKALFNALISSLGLNKVAYETYDVGRRGVPAGTGFPGPWYVKPARLGASFGITRVELVEQIPAAVLNAAAHDSLVLVEQEVRRPFVEVEVAAIVGRECLLSPPMEIVAPGALWRDSTWKYSLDERPVPYPSGGISDTCTHTVLKLIEAAGLAGAMRFDLFVSGDDVYVGEVNALPGHGIASMFPRIFEIAGVDRVMQLEAMLGAGMHLAERNRGLRVRR